ncbi:MAG: RhuM family protein [Anaerovoracaceae bacterium]
MNKNEIVLFETEDNAIKLKVPVRKETVWLSVNQMAALFDRDEKTIRKHINNVFSDGEVDKNNNTQKMRVEGVKQLVPYYTLDVIISVGYRVKSKRGVEFRRWEGVLLQKVCVEEQVIGSYNRGTSISRFKAEYSI